VSEQLRGTAPRETARPAGAEELIIASRSTVPVRLRWRMFEWMVLSRAIEDRLHRLHKQDRLRGRLVSGRGQEAIPVGATLALDHRDFVCPVHRDLGSHLVRGTTPATVLLHYFGRAAGPSHGREGDIHVGEWDKGVFPMVSHLPDSWPVAVGIAMTSRLRGDDRVVLAFCGDGATSTGTWHESMNFAAVMGTPNVFVVENNHYAYSVPTSQQFRVAHISERAAAYGMPGITVDGNDVVAVHLAVQAAVDRARRGDGPSLIEADTMRMDGHAIHDDASYVPPELLEIWRHKDPILRLSDELRREGATDEEIHEVEDRAAHQVSNAVEAAEAAPSPDPTELTRGVYA
jgi:TPP-dependent pyruvate/acetoin dehydrogenase alpha subunit